jgi:hypothetical protein
MNKGPTIIPNNGSRASYIIGPASVSNSFNLLLTF